MAMLPTNEGGDDCTTKTEAPLIIITAVWCRCVRSVARVGKGSGVRGQDSGVNIVPAAFSELKPTNETTQQTTASHAR